MNYRTCPMPRVSADHSHRLGRDDIAAGERRDFVFLSWSNAGPLQALVKQPAKQGCAREFD